MSECCEESAGRVVAGEKWRGDGEPPVIRESLCGDPDGRKRLLV